MELIRWMSRVSLRFIFYLFIYFFLLFKLPDIYDSQEAIHETACLEY